MTNFLYKNDIPADLDFGNSIAIDTETMGLKTTRDRLCVVQLSSGDGNAHLVQFDGSDYSAPNLRKLLSNDSVLKIFHFARFDICAIKYYLGVEVANVYCTKIASKLVRTYTDAHGLKALCSEFLSVEMSKKQQSSDWGNVQISKDQIKYAAQDVLYLHQLMERLNIMIEREGRGEIFAKCLEFLPTRCELDLIGFANLDIFNH